MFPVTDNISIPILDFAGMMKLRSRRRRFVFGVDFGELTENAVRICVDGVIAIRNAEYSRSEVLRILHCDDIVYKWREHNAHCSIAYEWLSCIQNLCCKVRYRKSPAPKLHRKIRVMRSTEGHVPVPPFRRGRLDASQFGIDLACLLLANSVLTRYLSEERLVSPTSESLLVNEASKSG
uniref:Uncharacterized protein n=1 Tax=Romanomermis culicivorax TaxID=13658 RepID=A0A915IDT2_ROMCU